MSQELNLLKRLQGETPKFFKRVIALSLTLSAVGAALVSVNAAIPGFVLPPFLLTLSQWFIVSGIVAAAVSKTTVTSSSFMANKFIKDTLTNQFLQYQTGTDIIIWVSSSASAHQFSTQEELDTQLSFLNTPQTPNRFIGHSGAGTPK